MKHNYTSIMISVVMLAALLVVAFPDALDVILICLSLCSLIWAIITTVLFISKNKRCIITKTEEYLISDFLKLFIPAIALPVCCVISLFTKNLLDNAYTLQIRILMTVILGIAIGYIPKLIKKDFSDTMRIKVLIVVIAIVVGLLIGIVVGKGYFDIKAYEF